MKVPDVGSRVRFLRSGSLGTVVEGRFIPLGVVKHYLVPVHWDACEKPGVVSLNQIEVLSPLEQLAEQAKAAQ